MTPQQTNFIYKKVELGSLINKNTIKEELDADIELERMDINSGDKNPYKELIVNNAGKIDTALTQIEQWSIFTNIINYVQYSKNPKNFHSMTIKPAKCNKVVKNTKSRNTNESLLEVNLVDSSDRSKEEYLDRCEGVKSEIVDTTRFDENSDLSTTYLGKINMIQDKDLIVEEKFPISRSGYTVGKLMDGTECQMLLDTGASKSFMSKSYYLHCKALHSLPKFALKTQRIQVGNGQHICVLFIIPVIIEIAGHRFKIYALVSEIHENIDLVLGINNVFELEGVFNSWECCFSFLNRSLPIFPKEKVIMKPGEQKIVKIEAPFTDEICSLAIIKLLDKLTHSVMVLKARFVHNIAMLDMINNSNSETLILNPGEALGILDLRSLGYYKIKQGVIQQRLSRFYTFESADEVCMQFNNLINTLRKEQKLDTGEKFPWLDDLDERKYMSDREILRKYINLDNTCLTEEEKEEVMDMLYKYKEAFSLRDEIGMCPNIKVGIEVMDKSPFFIRPYHIREEDKEVIDKDEVFVLFRNIKRRILAILNPSNVD